MLVLIIYTRWYWIINFYNLFLWNIKIITNYVRNRILFRDKSYAFDTYSANMSVRDQVHDDTCVEWTFNSEIDNCVLSDRDNKIIYKADQYE
ncbi:unnamed protein product [Rotaria sordida]|uniref:Uncharacterized protein n=1 Tax=Rotaria sordida TaxID=392033 RepID=A0A819LFR4_9BILA|nr:unnamed protein product [Rotaria sordida]